MTRSTDDFIHDEGFSSIDELKEKIPNASPKLISRLEEYLEERPTPKPHRLPAHVFKPRTRIYTMVLIRGNLMKRNNKTGRFMSLGRKKKRRKR
jgi:hypothetical protein